MLNTFEWTNNIVYCGATFDLFHSGHVNFLRQCSKIAGKHGRVIVALNTDEFIERYKGKPPIFSYKQRFEILQACKYVDCVMPNIGEEDSKKTILSCNPLPSIIVVGSDWAKKDYYKQMSFTQEWLDQHDITLVYVPYTEGISSTLIKEKLKE